MTFYEVKPVGPLPTLPLFGAVENLPWARRELIIPQSFAALRIVVTGFPAGTRSPNWRRFDPGTGVPRQFSVGSYAIGRRVAPLALETRPMTINRPEFIVQVPPPRIILPWAQPPGNSGNVPAPTLADRYWSLYLWLAEGAKVDVFDGDCRWLWVRE
jgi:hypothetical protein